MRRKTKTFSRKTDDSSLKETTLPGLNIQAPWSQYILSGKKTIETRFYPLPKKYIGKEMFIIETPGKKGGFKARIVGTVIFGESFVYDSKQAFIKDRTKHLVDETDSSFSWDSGPGKKKWGWPILRYELFRRFQIPSERRGIVFTRNIHFN